MPGTFSPPPRVSDSDMHHGTCVTHVPWCMPGSLTSYFLWSRWRVIRNLVLQECRDEWYADESLNTLFETIPDTCIVEFLREVGFFYLIWHNLLTSTSPQTWTIQLSLSNLFRKLKQLWDTSTCVGRLICPEGRVSSLNKSNPIQSYANHIDCSTKRPPFLHMPGRCNLECHNTAPSYNFMAYVKHTATVSRIPNQQTRCITDYI